MDFSSELSSGTGLAKLKCRPRGWLWDLVAIGVVILALRFFTGGEIPAGGSSGGLIKSSPVEMPVPGRDSVGKLREKRRLELEKEKLRADVAARAAKYCGDVRVIVEKYRGMLPLSEAEAGFRRAEQGVDFIAGGEGLCGFRACAKLAYKMAYDQIKGTHRAEDAINPLVNDRVVVPINEAVGVYGQWTRELRQELQREEMAFALDLAVRSQQFSETVSCIREDAAAKMGMAVDRLVDEVRKHARESVFAAAGAAVELAMIKGTYATIKTVAMKVAGMALGGVVKKLATTATSAAISALADGPLPIGDIVAGCITVVGCGWTAYDIYRVCEIMPRQLRDGIRPVIAETRESLRKTAEENLNSDLDVCLRSAEARVDELNALIEGQ